MRYDRAMKLRSLITWGASMVLGVAAGLVGYGQTSVTLNPGDTAPAFSLPGSDGKTYRLADYAGKSAVVIAWFPKAFTGG
jgi:hypothetical protein